MCTLAGDRCTLAGDRCTLAGIGVHWTASGPRGQGATASGDPGGPGTSRLSREASANIRQIIMTLTLLLSNAEQTDGLLAYGCKNIRGTVKPYALTPQEGCWSEQP
jgi:hypothetical protein